MPRPARAVSQSCSKGFQLSGPQSLRGSKARRYSPRPEYHKSLAAAPSESLTAARSHSPPPESLAAARVWSPGHSGAAAHRHSVRPATGNRRGPTSLAAARRHCHSPRLASLAAARRSGPGPSPRPAVTRRGRPSFTSLSHSPRRRPSRPGPPGLKSIAAARVRVTHRGPPSLTAACRHSPQLASLAAA